jgi:hypothetical protein
LVLVATASILDLDQNLRAQNWKQHQTLLPLDNSSMAMHITTNGSCSRSTPIRNRICHRQLPSINDY